MSILEHPFVRTAALAATTVLASACAGRPPVPTQQETAMTSERDSSSASVVREFFAAFGRGDLEGVVATFHPNAEIIAVRNAPRGENDVYGTYTGSEGARTFVRTLGQSFDTQAFTVDRVIGEGDVAFASGSFVHRVRSTGRTFRSDWALRCLIADGKIREYRFYEDSAAYVEASR